MELAKRCRYAVQGLVYLASQGSVDRPVMLRDIAAAVGAPEAFLSKIFQGLRASAIIRSHRGVDRGYSLARDPSEVTLYDVILATQGLASLHSPELASGEAGAAFGRVWDEVENLVAERLRKVTLSELVELQASSQER